MEHVDPDPCWWRLSYSWLSFMEESLGAVVAELEAIDAGQSIEHHTINDRNRSIIDERHYPFITFCRLLELIPAIQKLHTEHPPPNTYSPPLNDIPISSSPEQSADLARGLIGERDTSPSAGEEHLEELDLVELDRRLEESMPI